MYFLLIIVLNIEDEIVAERNVITDNAYFVKDFK